MYNPNAGKHNIINPLIYRGGAKTSNNITVLTVLSRSFKRPRLKQESRQQQEIKKKNLASFYIHGMFEARFKTKLLEEIFKFIKRNKIRNKRIIDYL